MAFCAEADTQELCEAVRGLEVRAAIGLEIKSSAARTLLVRQMRPGKEIQRERAVCARIEHPGYAAVPLRQVLVALESMGDATGLAVEGNDLVVSDQEHRVTVERLPDDFMERVWPAESPRVALFGERDRMNGRAVWLQLTAGRELLLEGRDLGDPVRSYFGNDVSEYEWAWTLPRSELKAFFANLNIEEDASASLPAPVCGRLTHAELAAQQRIFADLCARLRAVGEQELQPLFRSAGARFWSRVGD